MFGIGFGELAVIAVVLLIAVGPGKMPSLFKAVGKGLREFRRATRELRDATGIDELLRDDDLRRPLRPVPRAAPQPPPAPRRRGLNEEERAAETPEEGVDLAHAKTALEREKEKAATHAASDGAPAATGEASTTSGGGEASDGAASATATARKES